jgi:glycosyltransferase involved in cell wall biosynthesis
MTPKISIITATHRRPDLLYKCIKSVQTSTLQEYEHIIVGDHCDWAERVCDSFPFDERIKYFETPHPHVWNAGASSKNIGIEKAQTDYIVYCDDDNIVLENHLEVMYNELLKGTQICASKLYEVTLEDWGNGSIKTLMKMVIPKSTELGNGNIHYGDMQCYGHTKLLSDKVGGWITADEIQYDRTWLKSSVNEDGYLLRKFKKLGGEKTVFLDSISVIYYGRGACSNTDYDYESLLDKDKLFVYPELVRGFNE